MDIETIIDSSCKAIVMFSDEIAVAKIPRLYEIRGILEELSAAIDDRMLLLMSGDH